MTTSDLSGETLGFIKVIGVNHICATDYRHSGYEELGYWDGDLLAEMRMHEESYGIQLTMVALPLPNIMLATGKPAAETEATYMARRLTSG